MKPFDLEKALAGEPVITKEGKEVTQLTYFDTIERHCLYGVVDGEVYSWNIDGKIFIDPDLFMAPKIKKRWVNLYHTETGHVICSVPFESNFESNCQAICNISTKIDYTYLKTVEVEIPV